MKITKFFLLGAFSILSISAKAQNITQNSVWGASFNSIKLSEKTGLHFDAQFRSADDVAYLRNVLIRPGFTYFFDQTKNATLGYAFILTNQGAANTKDLIEHRIWEQFILNVPLSKKITLTNRLRLEQRFIDQNNNDVFSQRIRYFVRSVIPIKKQEEKFTKGLFAALQNEVFLNIQNKSKLNNKVFDQNRAYAAIGYRLNSKFDIEIGYLNQYSKGLSANTINNVFQLAVYTKF
jgi:hypothetical protein